jgi:membrane protein DedA with SNARE-associated domain
VLLFLGAALESAAFLGFLVPGETIVIAGGVLASFGVLDLRDTLVVAVTGAIVGDNVGYVLGRRLGRPWLESHGRLIGMHGGMLRRIDDLFARHGGKAVLIGRFIGFLRAMAPFAAGASHMPYPRFAIANAIGATSWGIFFVLLGFFLGESWHIAERWLGRVGVVVGTVVLVATILWLRRARRRDATRLDPGSRG